MSTTYTRTIHSRHDPICPHVGDPSDGGSGPVTYWYCVELQNYTCPEDDYYFHNYGNPEFCYYTEEGSFNYWEVSGSCTYRLIPSLEIGTLNYTCCGSESTITYTVTCNTDCETPDYGRYPASDPQRDESAGTGGSRFKKNNPGCNCCGRVLIWDIGAEIPFGYPPTNPTQFNQVGYQFQNFELLQEWFEAEGYGVDFLTGGNFQEPGFYEGAGGDFDPYPDPGATDKFWTGDIFDYSLIIIVLPVDFEDLDTSAEPCYWCKYNIVRTLTPHAHGDHEELGGEPEWWFEVAQGLWRGRVVVVSHANTNILGDTTGADIGYATNTFLINSGMLDAFGITANNYGLTDVSIEQAGEPFGEDPQAGVATVVGDTDLTEPVEVEEDDGAIVELSCDNFPAGQGTAWTGGDTVISYQGVYALQTNPEWCYHDVSDPDGGYTYDESYDVVQRMTIVKGDSDAEVPVDLVCVGTLEAIPVDIDEEDGHPWTGRSYTQEELDSLRCFWVNVLTKPVVAPESGVSG